MESFPVGSYPKVSLRVKGKTEALLENTAINIREQESIIYLVSVVVVLLGLVGMI